MLQLDPRGLVGHADDGSIVVNLIRTGKLTDADLACFSGCKGISSIVLTPVKFDGSCLQYFDASSDSVIEFRCGGMGIGRKEYLAHIARMSKLRILEIKGPAVDDNTSGFLANLTKLQYLVLDGTRVSDGTMKLVAQLSALRTLHLNETLVGDDGAVLISAFLV